MCTPYIPRTVEGRLPANIDDLRAKFLVKNPTANFTKGMDGVIHVIEANGQVSGWGNHVMSDKWREFVHRETMNLWGGDLSSLPKFGMAWPCQGTPAEMNWYTECRYGEIKCLIKPEVLIEREKKKEMRRLEKERLEQRYKEFEEHASGEYKARLEAEMLKAEEIQKAIVAVKGQARVEFATRETVARNYVVSQLDTPVDKKRGAIPKKIRGEVWKSHFGESMKGLCFCCKAKFDVFDTWHAGHIVPSVKGGADVPSNLRPVCASCNLSMGTENMDVFKARCYPG